MRDIDGPRAYQSTLKVLWGIPRIILVLSRSYLPPRSLAASLIHKLSVSVMLLCKHKNLMMGCVTTQRSNLRTYVIYTIDKNIA